MTENNHKYRLDAFQIYRAEREASFSREPYTEAEMKGIEQMAYHLEIYILQKYPELMRVMSLRESSDYYEEKREELLSGPHQKKELGRFPVPTFFLTKDSVYEYDHEDAEWSISLKEGADIFSLFFAFRIRNLHYLDLLRFLNEQKAEFEGDFEFFLKGLLIERKELLTEENQSYLQAWLQQSRQPSPSLKPKAVSHRLSRDTEKEIVERHLAFLSGYNIMGKKIMREEDYKRVLEYTHRMIKEERLPEGMTVVPQINIPSNFLRFTYYQIHKELYTSNRIKGYFIDFLHQVFRQFENTMPSTTKTKFSQPPKSYYLDLEDMQGNFGE
jgi:hypothetical protein